MVSAPPRPAPPTHPPLRYGAPVPESGPVACYHCGKVGEFGVDMIIERYGPSTAYGYAYACEQAMPCWRRWDEQHMGGSD